MDTKVKQCAPNRLLDLSELDRPEYRRVLAEMDDLVAREDISYLHLSKRWEYPWALERGAPTSRECILDAGCGASIFPIYLATQGLDVFALDLDPPLRLAEAHGVAVNYVRGDLTELPFANESFDQIYCISVIEHLPRSRIPLAMAEFRRVLRTGGQLLLTTDYYEDADAEMWYEDSERRFRVDWNVFDERLLSEFVLNVPGLCVEGALDLQADWETLRPQMQRFHGYPYTAVGVALVKEPPTRMRSGDACPHAHAHRDTPERP